MSTLAEIQEAITKLPKEQKNVLSLWLNSQAAVPLAPHDEEILLKSLDEAIQDVDAGRGVSLAWSPKRTT